MTFLSNLKEHIYHLSPVLLQNQLVSFYGKRLYKQRYSGNYSRLLNEIRAEDSQARQAIEQSQLIKLKGILKHAEKHVPYYQQLFKDYSIDPEKFTSLTDLQYIPPLEKEVIRNNAELFLSTRPEDKAYFLQKTSGSTGKPMQVSVDEVTYKRAMALLVHHEESFGVQFGDPRATFTGRLIQRVDNMSPPFSRFNKAENQRLFSSYHLSDKTIQTYVDELNAFQPQELIGYPSAIYLVAFLIEKHSIIFDFKPKIIITNSETLLDWQKEKIEKVFKTPVRDYYGSAEYVVFARQCGANDYHISSTLGYLEVVDENNKPIFNREGDIVCTTLSNYTMPLIRYRVGDRAVKSTSMCGCGNQSETLSAISGRIDDYIITLDGRKIGRMDHIYKGMKGIQEGQLIQTDKNRCLVKLVASDRNEIDEQSLKYNFYERVGGGIQLDIEYVAEIPKSKNGKFKAVINKIS